jgi:hypothetical protein
MRSTSSSACFISSRDSSRIFSGPFVAPVLAEARVQPVLVDLPSLRLRLILNFNRIAWQPMAFKLP